MLVTLGTWRVGKMMVATQCLAVYPLYNIKDVSKSKICKTQALSSLTVKIDFLCNIFGFDVCVLVTNKYFSILFECPVLCFDPVIKFIPYQKNYGSLYISEKLLTYPSPKSTSTLTSHLIQNVGLGKGWVVSFPDGQNDLKLLLVRLFTDSMFKNLQHLLFLLE